MCIYICIYKHIYTYIYIFFFFGGGVPKLAALPGGPFKSWVYFAPSVFVQKSHVWGPEAIYEQEEE